MVDNLSLSFPFYDFSLTQPLHRLILPPFPFDSNLNQQDVDLARSGVMRVFLLCNTLFLHVWSLGWISGRSWRV